MRLFHKLSSLFCFLLLTGVLFAHNVEPTLAVLDAEKKVLLFEAGDLASTSVDVRFEDEKGKVLFSEYVVTPSTFIRHYNLSEMPNGVYQLVIAADAKTYVLPILVESKSVTIDQELKYLK